MKHDLQKRPVHRRHLEIRQAMRPSRADVREGPENADAAVRAALAA